MFSKSFPKEIRDDVLAISKIISIKPYSNISSGVTDECCDFFLLDGQLISIPYRMYYRDDWDCLLSTLTFNQKMIYHAIFTRNYDGFIREKHLKSILSEDFPSWVIPYIFKLSNEYVAQILEISFEMIPQERIEEFKKICRLNIQYFLKSHDRVISYWNEFYRHECYLYENYIGKKLYEEYFGYTRNLEKLRVF